MRDKQPHSSHRRYRALACRTLGDSLFKLHVSVGIVVGLANVAGFRVNAEPLDCSNVGTCAVVGKRSCATCEEPADSTE